MQSTNLDYIIVGQGLAGTWLSYELIKRGKSILVIDQESENTASKKAAGLYNPITGRKMIKTWRADDLFGSLEDDYLKLEKVLDSKFLFPTPIYRPFRDVADLNDWELKKNDKEYLPYVKKVLNKPIGIKDILDNNGGVTIKKCGYVDIPSMLQSYKNYLINKGIYRQELFETVSMEHFEGGVVYKNWTAKKIIFCEGSRVSKVWMDLPFRPVRGEVMDIECSLPDDYIVNQGVFILPKKGYFSVGSTYDHKVLSHTPQESGIKSIQNRLGKIFVGKYRILEKRAGVRPATHDRRPYIGFHKNHETLGIFNGFGAKGVSLAPYFAKHFADVLDRGVELDKDVNIERVY